MSKYHDTFDEFSGCFVIICPFSYFLWFSKFWSNSTHSTFLFIRRDAKNALKKLLPTWQHGSSSQVHQVVARHGWVATASSATRLWRASLVPSPVARVGRRAVRAPPRRAKSSSGLSKHFMRNHIIHHIVISDSFDARYCIIMMCHVMLLL